MGFFTALRFLTIIPLPSRWGAGAEEAGRSLRYFPLVGLLLGLILIGLDRLFGLALPLLLTDALLIIALVILTGALHLDGFIDTCDGAVLRSSPRERLEVMADSRAGSFGVVGACCLLLLQYVALITVPENLRMTALLLMPVLSRWAMVYAVFAFPYAREIGMGRAFKQQANWQGLTIATVICLLVAVAVTGIKGMALMAALWLIILGVASYLRSRLGGLTGDSYGAVNELAEVLVLILLPLMARAITTDYWGGWIFG